MKIHIEAKRRVSDPQDLLTVASAEHAAEVALASSGWPGVGRGEQAVLLCLLGAGRKLRDEEIIRECGLDGVAYTDALNKLGKMEAVEYVRNEVFRIPAMTYGYEFQLRPTRLGDDLGHIIAAKYMVSDGYLKLIQEYIEGCEDKF